MFKKAKPLKNPEDVDHGYNYALFLLNLSMRTEGEIREKMKARGYIPKVIDEVIAKLHQDKYVNDEYYAEMFLENMKRFKYYGRFTVRRKMSENKLPKEIIESSLQEFFTAEDEREIAKHYIEKQFGELKTVRKFDYEDKQKVMRKVLSRGFGMDVAQSLLN